MERPLVTAVTHSTDEARVTLTGVPDEPGVAGRIFGALADANINVDMIIQNEPVSHDGGADLSFTVEAEDLEGAVEAIRLEDSEIGIETDEAMGKVSIVGAGMRSHPGVAAKVFRVLGENKINIEMISTSPIKISCVIRADQVPQAVEALHTSFELGRGRDPQGRADGRGAPPDGELPGTTVTRDGSWRIPRRGRRRHGSSRLDDPRGARRAEVPREPRCGRSHRRAPPEARCAFAGGELEVRELTEESIQGLDLILSSAGGKVSSEWAPKLDRGGRGGRRQHQLLADARRRAAGGGRRQRRRGRRPQRPGRQPELHDDAADGRAQADPRRGRASSG